jgi:D-glycero-alpha-D-manno-heptose 1-phosphate guanylyltransferase
MYEAIILAGGLGTRLKDAIPDLPKAMAPIQGKPFLAYLLENLSKKGFKRAILSLGYMPERIIDYFEASFKGIDIIYSVENEPLGTGGATKLALEKSTQDHVYLINGDTYLDFDAQAVEDLWLNNKCPIIIGVEVEDTSRYGRLIFMNNKVQGLLEKGLTGPGIINAGCYVLNRNQLDEFEVGKPFSLETDYLSGAVKRQDFLLFATKGKFIDIGIPEDYRLAQAFFS